LLRNHGPLWTKYLATKKVGFNLRFNEIQPPSDASKLQGARTTCTPAAAAARHPCYRRRELAGVQGPDAPPRGFHRPTLETVYHLFSSSRLEGPRHARGAGAIAEGERDRDRRALPGAEPHAAGDHGAVRAAAGAKPKGRRITRSPILCLPYVPGTDARTSKEQRRRACGSSCWAKCFRTRRVRPSRAPCPIRMIEGSMAIAGVRDAVTVSTSTFPVTYQADAARPPLV
jgi:hypothetical protein